jgi:glycosyltransferase involved in cell wall biosynthesis
MERAPVRRVLLVSYYFPPLAGSGVFRPLRLAKYLPRHGWDVTVLTVSARARVIQDPALVDDVPPSVAVERTSSLEPRVPLLVLHRLGLGSLARRIEPWFLVPDDQRGWVPFAVARGERVLAARPHDVVVSTAGPYSAHLAGLALKRRAGIPWVADFRDEWTTNPYLVDRYPTEWHRRRNRAMERATLGSADRVVCVSEPWLNALRSVAPDEPWEKFRVHPNGYDAEHFPGAAPRRPDRFRVVYAGSFYGHRTPGTFLEGVRLALGSGGIPAEEIEVLFVGQTGEAPPEAGLPPGVLRTAPQRPYFESLRLLQEAAVLLLVIPREGGEGNHTGKLFPYLASGRPILALAPEPNVAADLIRRTRSGVVVAPDRPDEVAKALVGLHRDHRAGRALAGQDRVGIAAYEADAQAQAYARLLQELLPSGRSRRIDTRRAETVSSE